MSPGYYWVQRFKDEQQMSVARLTKQSGWEFFGRPWTKMVKKIGETHPYRVCYRIDDYDEQRPHLTYHA